eukprot:TRINITY_DN8881_c0_g2_i1.p2 TRINITY_DN8881_c0_g2~~TRINITY_DN8881_c0_g2_i1.p2  ORF type:complete len:103 (-),score=2.81 TRINITY_DN8881_c0_g2_i1:365-673(-)
MPQNSNRLTTASGLQHYYETLSYPSNPSPPKKPTPMFCVPLVVVTLTSTYSSPHPTCELLHNQLPHPSLPPQKIQVSTPHTTEPPTAFTKALQTRPASCLTD